MTDTLEAEAPAPAKPARARMADGIYLGLPMAQYVNDDALSGSGVATLLSEPGAFQWERADNPLYDASESKPQLRGSAVHCAVLEGIEAYDAGYCVAPTGAHILTSGDSMGAWLKAARDCGREDLAGLKISGKVAELRERVLEARQRLAEDDALYPRFADELIGGRALLSEQDDMFVRLLERFVRGASFAPLVTDGVPEVSIFMTRSDGVRVKCRTDYLTAAAITDLKSYGRPPGRARTLKKHLIREAFYNGYDLQAVHNHQTVLAAGREHLASPDRFSIIGADVDTGTKLERIFEAHQKKAPVFHWLFLRMGGAITGIDIPFRQSDGRWQMSSGEIAEAIDILKAYRKRCGADELWLTDDGRQEIEDLDWPLDAWEGRA